MKNKPKKLNTDKENRENAKKQGFYDGRFRNKVIPNKKKEEEKNASRKYKK